MNMQNKLYTIQFFLTT